MSEKIPFRRPRLEVGHTTFFRQQEVDNITFQLLIMDWGPFMKTNYEL